MKNILVLFFAIIFGVVLIKGCMRGQEVSKWPSVEGHVTSSEIIKKVEQKTKTQNDRKVRYTETKYVLKLTYEYEVNGTPYSGRAASFGESSSLSAKQKQQRYPDGKSVNVKFDPENPYDSVVKI